MSKQRTVTQLVIPIVICFGLILIISSAFIVSSFITILGLTTIFFATILFYLKPKKHVPITLLITTTSVNSSNIERILTELNLTEKAIYLPPKNLNEIDSNLIFIPNNKQVILPTSSEITDSLYCKQKNGILINPLGSALIKLLEQEIGSSFTKLDFGGIQKIIPQLFIENLSLAESIEIHKEANIVKIEVMGNQLFDICQQTENTPMVHRQIGCLLSSAMACMLAKTLGKPVTIENETNNRETKGSKITLSIED